MNFLNQEILIFTFFDENRYFSQKSKIFTKIEIFQQNRKFQQKSKYFTRIENFNKNRFFLPKTDFFIITEINPFFMTIHFFTEIEIVHQNKF